LFDFEPSKGRKSTNDQHKGLRKQFREMRFSKSADRYYFSVISVRISAMANILNFIS